MQESWLRVARSIAPAGDLERLLASLDSDAVVRSDASARLRELEIVVL